MTFNTVSSFITNTNWQYYGGETTMSFFSQMAGLAVQNFVSAAVGIVVAVALIRGDRRAPHRRDRPRQLLAGPHAHAAATCCCRSRSSARWCSPPRASCSRSAQWGPVASQEIIKELGTNGGGFFNVNSAMPFENPNGLTNFLEMLAILVDPGVADVHVRPHGRQPPAGLDDLRRDVRAVRGLGDRRLRRRVRTSRPPSTPPASIGANLEGKELRFGTAGTSLWTAVTTVTSCGAVNAAFESLTGIGGLVPMVNLAYGESVFGGVGTGLYTMLLYVLLAVFIGGLMVGRTPEYLGKKIEAREVKLVVLGLLFTPLAILVATAPRHRDRSTARRRSSPPGRRASRESLYAYMSQANNNGSAFAGYTGYFQPDARQPRRPRHHVRRPARRHDDDARALHPDRLHARRRRRDAQQARRPRRPGHDAHGHAHVRRPAVGTVVLIGALTFFPALLLGPVVQGMTDQLF